MSNILKPDYYITNIAKNQSAKVIIFMCIFELEWTNRVRIYAQTRQFAGSIFNKCKNNADFWFNLVGVGDLDNPMQLSAALFEKIFLLWLAFYIRVYSPEVVSVFWLSP